jgi:hypothetical protein
MANITRPSAAPLDFIRRFWFPTALIVLLILAIPGVALFVLNIFGMEGDVNRWLETNFKLSYSIPIPWWGAFILLLVPLFIASTAARARAGTTSS